MRQCTLALALVALMEAPRWAAALLVVVICGAISVCYNVLQADLEASSGLLATAIAAALGWVMLVAYDRYVHSRLQAALRVRREALGKGLGLFRSYLTLFRSRPGRHELGRLLAADYLAYIATQLIPLALSLWLSGTEADKIWPVVWPVMVASPLLSVALGMLITYSDKLFGGETPNAACTGAP